MPDNKPRMTAAEMTERAYHSFLDAKGLSPRAGQVDMMAFCSEVVNATPSEEQYRVGVLRQVRGQGKHSGIVCL
jgi:ATP-dependent DNA helicase DinG